MHTKQKESIKSFAHVNVPVGALQWTSLEVGAHAYGLRSNSAVRRLNGLVEQKWFADVFYFGDRALEIKGLGQHDFEDLW